MTWLGKVLVLFNLALSLMLMIWALMLFTNRVDWSDQRGKDGRPDGELVRRQAQTKELWDAIPVAEYAWRKNRDTLVLLEEGTPPDRKDGRLANLAWYEAEKRHLRTGAVPDANNSARAVEFLVKDGKDKTRELIPDAKNFGRPTMGVPKDSREKTLVLGSLAYYQKEEKANRAAQEKEDKRLKDAIVLDTQLTDLLNGNKGLKQRLIDAQLYRTNVLAEHNEIKRPLINANVESELLLRRKRQLEYRIDELQKARAARLAGLGNQQ
jgi:hypothetical protein